MLDQGRARAGVFAGVTKQLHLFFVTFEGICLCRHRPQAVDALADGFTHGIGEHCLHPGGTDQLRQELIVTVGCVVAADD